MEVFTGKQMGNSNIILLGSANQMSRTGSSGYIFDWLACAEKIVSRWPNVKVCPLVPIWSESVSGKLVRTVQELCSVFQSLFGNDLHGLGNSWTVLTRELAEQLSRQMPRIPNPLHTLCHSQLVCQVPQKSRVGPFFLTPEMPSHGATAELQGKISGGPHASRGA